MGPEAFTGTCRLKIIGSACAGPCGADDHPADGAAAFVAEPDIAVDARGDGDGLAVGCGDRVFGEYTGSRHPSDLVVPLLRKPDVAVGTDGDGAGKRARRRERILRNRAVPVDAPDLVARGLGKPDDDMPRRIHSNTRGTAGGRGNGILGEHAGRRNELADLVAILFGKKDRTLAIRARGNPCGSAVECGNGKLPRQRTVPPLVSADLILCGL